MLRKINIVPRWVIFLIDSAICTFAFISAFILGTEVPLVQINTSALVIDTLIVCYINTIVFYNLRTYAGIIRYTGTQDALRIFYATFITLGVLSVLNLFGFKVWSAGLSSTLLVISINFLFSFISLIIYRLLIKQTFAYFRYYKLDRKQVIIYGAGEAGFATMRGLSHDTKSNISIVAFLDDNPLKIDKIIDGVPVHSQSNLKKLAKNNRIDELIIATFSLSVTKKKELIENCLNLGIKVLNVPPFEQWINGEFSPRQLKVIKIEQLLEREPIEINNQLILDQITDKRILVTGAAGSIGSEIVRQLVKFNPEAIILCDQAETPLHQLELELQDLNLPVNCVFYLSDVSNQARMEELFSLAKPHYVYHAAAYKHVPMMERCPSEAILTNVKGTKVLADLAVKHHVERFVMVSTDKAVNPTNVMGASKRLAEIYIQSLAAESQTKFITTRFGNVLGSNGSVLLRFKEQIEKGGPVTVTHPEITRFFMTIPEACQLVLEAGSMGKGGELFVFDMGQSVRIADLAHKMIRLYGFLPNKDIQIEYIGLRPGEKLYEELLTDSENTLPTYHDKIMIAQVREELIDHLKNQLEELFMLAVQPEAAMQLVAKMKEMVPEFVSNNSVFEELDLENEKQKGFSISRTV